MLFNFPFIDCIEVVIFHRHLCGKYDNNEVRHYWFVVVSNHTKQTQMFKAKSES
jgi:hypothetical protein